MKNIRGHGFIFILYGECYMEGIPSSSIRRRIYHELYGGQTVYQSLGVRLVLEEAR